MLPWFRYYHETLDDPKVQGLPDSLFKAWVNMLCIAARNGGKIPERDLAFSLRIDERKVLGVIESLETRSLLDRDEKGALRPHNWDGRQFQSDDSGPRVKRHRQRHGNGQRNGQCNGQSNGEGSGEETSGETPPEQTQIQNRTDAEKDSSGSTTKVSRETLDRAVADWNEMASKNGLSVIRQMTDKRKRALPLRLRELGGLDAWRRMLAKIVASPFLLGDNNNGWRIDFDFVMSPNNLAKVTEGKYDARPGKNSIQGALDDLGDWLGKGQKDS